MEDRLPYDDIQRTPLDKHGHEGGQSGSRSLDFEVVLVIKICLFFRKKNRMAMSHGTLGIRPNRDI